MLKALRQRGAGALAAVAFAGRRSSQGAMKRICRKRSSATIPTTAKNNPQRVSSMSVFCMLCTVVKATIGRNRPTASSAVNAVSFSARTS